MNKSVQCEVTMVTFKVVMNEPGYATIQNDISCGVTIPTSEGSVKYICERIYDKSGHPYLLERYDPIKKAVHYRRQEK